jgi:ribosomal protein S18 acetylase RimI-like enzyme
LDQANAGYNATVLFTRPRERLIAGFLTVASSALKLAKIRGVYPKFGPPPGVETQNVPVWLVAYMGVHRDHQGGTYGEEMHVWLLKEMVGLLGAPRFLYLQCWVENQRALKFWSRMGYKEFDRTPEQYGDKSRELAWLLLDRFLITPPVEPAPA